MITTYILGADKVWDSICDANGENDHDLAASARAALADHWGEGDDMDAQLRSLGGGIRLDVSRVDAEPDAIVAVARSLDGRFFETVRVERG